jgi:hypothetical protein
VIFDASYLQRLAIDAVRRPAHDAFEFITPRFVDQGFAIFGREDSVDVDFGERLGHTIAPQLDWDPVSTAMVFCEWPNIKHDVDTACKAGSVSPGVKP